MRGLKVESHWEGPSGSGGQSHQRVGVCTVNGKVSDDNWCVKYVLKTHP